MYQSCPIKNVPVLSDQECTRVVWSRMYQCCLIKKVPALSDQECTSVVWSRMYQRCLIKNVPALSDQECTSVVCCLIKNVPALSDQKCTSVVWSRMYQCCLIKNVPTLSDQECTRVVWSRMNEMFMHFSKFFFISWSLFCCRKFWEINIFQAYKGLYRERFNLGNALFKWRTNCNFNESLFNNQDIPPAQSL